MNKIYECALCDKVFWSDADLINEFGEEVICSECYVKLNNGSPTRQSESSLNLGFLTNEWGATQLGKKHD